MKIAVVMEFNGLSEEEIQELLSSKFADAKGYGVKASVLNQQGYEEVEKILNDEVSER